MPKSMVTNPAPGQISGRLCRGSMQYLPHAPHLGAWMSLAGTWANKPRVASPGFPGSSTFRNDRWESRRGSDMIEQHHY